MIDCTYTSNWPMRKAENPKALWRNKQTIQYKGESSKNSR